MMDVQNGLLINQRTVIHFRRSKVSSFQGEPSMDPINGLSIN